MNRLCVRHGWTQPVKRVEGQGVKKVTLILDLEEGGRIESCAEGDEEREVVEEASRIMYESVKHVEMEDVIRQLKGVMRDIDDAKTALRIAQGKMELADRNAVQLFRFIKQFV